jgi:NAD(P)-dependent dehydrogenase (short-subunit alcohol dehydrogenase family)
MGASWAALEALTCSLAAELGAQGIRVVCLRPDAIPETETIHDVFGLHAKGIGITRDGGLQSENPLILEAVKKAGLMLVSE